ncbi:hypothetical protein OCS_01788 [Ophiocordyceps sinensis CO18]|nr:hypothetical protein OCS_01788 [Ophiocordyceps sinensis CO18]
MDFLDVKIPEVRPDIVRWKPVFPDIRPEHQAKTQELREQLSRKIRDLRERGGSRKQQVEQV